MLIHQFEDRFLSHFSYAIVHGNEMVLIDPSRNPQPYYDFATRQSAKIIAVIETHLHADFVSSHVEIANTTGASIFMHPSAQPEFPFHPFDDDTDEIALGNYLLKAIHTPGHSPDSICILLKDERGNPTTVFTGDTLFVGDVGRPDLRETTFTHEATREKLARQMFHSLHEKLMRLNDEVVVFPAHGSGSLCGKNLSLASSSTIGSERVSNVALAPKNESDFVEMLLADQPMVPKYFSGSVAANRRKDIATFGQAMKGAINEVANDVASQMLVIDPRPAASYKQSHIKNSINIPDDKKFETWVGAIVSPDENFVISGEDREALVGFAERIVKIGYEKNLKGFLAASNEKTVQSNSLEVSVFANQQDEYTIVDVRNNTERKTQTIFENSLHIPLHQLRERTNEIPKDKPVVTHCGGGNRGAIAASILEAENISVYDLGMDVKKFISTTVTR